MRSASTTERHPKVLHTIIYQLGILERDLPAPRPQHPITLPPPPIRVPPVKHLVVRRRQVRRTSSLSATGVISCYTLPRNINLPSVHPTRHLRSSFGKAARGHHGEHSSPTSKLGLYKRKWVTCLAPRSSRVTSGEARMLSNAIS
jgi:hypothetical protein